VHDLLGRLLQESTAQSRLVGGDGFFAALAGYARRHADADLALWWSPRRCQATWGALIHPHGFGRWQQRGAVLDFFLECDRADDAPSRLTAAVAGYEELARATPQLATVTLLWMTTTKRETETRRALRPRGCLIATATPLGGRNPAEAVWLPLGATAPRQRLASLANPNCWSSDGP
jgi:hypothetical protein